ncbi:tyrosine-type recombinase/integrase [Macrococcoides caseolyticum]|uniref:Integrase n=1 Tax=Macrococcus caseolyticus (strain JCSC5402) TaxID=458233 RepID=B9E7T4_MACCJ|nr:tyrosine-type recombinase/integrase [Macrococcus caseolyticus]BAH18252.1 integrase [Macrococcus caseolyticus JCSC5402]
MNITKHNNVWQYDFRYEGKRYRKRGFKTKREAQQKALEVKSNLSKGFVIDEKTPFVDYYNKYVELNKEGKVSEKHLQRYKSSIKVFEEKFGRIHISKVSKMMYQELLNEYAEGKFLDGREEGRATSSVEKLNGCLREAIREALHEGIIFKDPTYRASVKGKKSAKLAKDKFLTLEQFKELKKFSMRRKELSYLMIYLLVVTGARFKEVQHVKLTDFNKNENTLHIRGTKTKSADRVIQLSQKDIDYVLGYAKDKPINISGHLFDTGYNLISHNAVSRLFKDFLIEQRAGHKTLHSIRHTHVSWLIDLGLDIYYISQRVGHANITITQGIYGHLFPERQKENDLRISKELDAI